MIHEGERFITIVTFIAHLQKACPLSHWDDHLASALEEILFYPPYPSLALNIAIMVMSMFSCDRSYAQSPLSMLIILFYSPYPSLALSIVLMVMSMFFVAGLLHSLHLALCMLTTWLSCLLSMWLLLCTTIT